MHALSGPVALEPPEVFTTVASLSSRRGGALLPQKRAAFEEGNVKGQPVAREGLRRITQRDMISPPDRVSRCYRGSPPGAIRSRLAPPIEAPACRGRRQTDPHVSAQSVPTLRQRRPLVPGSCLSAHRKPGRRRRTVAGMNRQRQLRACARRVNGQAAQTSGPG